MTRSPRSDARERNRQLGARLARETAKILTARHDFDPGAFGQYLEAVSRSSFPPLPDEIAPEWV